MSVGVKTGSLEWHYQITHRNVLDKEFDKIVSAGAESLKNHIINDSIRSIIDLFVIYKKMDDALMDHYFAYGDPKPLFFDGTYKNDEEDSMPEQQEDAYSHIAHDPEKDEDSQPEALQPSYINPHEDIFKKIQSMLKSTLEGMSGTTVLQVDSAILDEEYDNTASGYEQAPDYLRVTTGGESTLLEDVYPADGQITQDVQHILLSKSKIIVTLCGQIKSHLQPVFDTYQRAQENALREGVARPERRNRYRNERVPKQKDHRYGHEVTYGGYNRRIHDGSYIGKREKDPLAANTTAKQRELLEQQIEKNKILTEAEKQATKRVIQYMTKGEASTLIDRFLKENLGANYKTRDELQRSKNDTSGNGEDLPF